MLQALTSKSMGLWIRDLPLADGSVGVFIRGFDINGQAWIDGQLFTDDQLISINDVSLLNM